MVKETENKEMQNKEDNREYVPTVLSLLEFDENVMSDVQKEILEEELSEFQQIKEGEVNIAGVYVYDSGNNEEKVEVKAYIRNGLAKSINLERIPLFISNSKNKILAYQVFNLSSLGTIPAHSARPVKLYFERKNVAADNIDSNDWKIAFDAKVNVERSIKVQYEDLPEEIDIEDKLVYDKFLNELPELKEGQFNVSTFSIGMQKEGNIIITLVMRNATDKPFGIGKLPVTLRDGNGVAILSEEFELSNFKVNPLKAKICNIMFPTSVKIEEDRALRDWSVSFNLEQIGTKR